MATQCPLSHLVTECTAGGKEADAVTAYAKRLPDRRGEPHESLGMAMSSSPVKRAHQRT
jgi:hypothetical protein